MVGWHHQFNGDDFEQTPGDSQSLPKGATLDTLIQQNTQIILDSHLGFVVHHQLPEIAQTHVHRVGDAIQRSHPLLSPSPPAINLSQHQGLFK